MVPKHYPVLVRRLFIYLLLICLMPLTAASGSLASPALQLTTGFDNSRIHTNRPDQRYLEVLVTTPDAQTFGQHGRRLPLNIALVLDTSGSMAHQRKLEHTKKAALALLDRLRPGDRFALVTYSDRARTLIASEPVENLHRARSLIQSMRAGGGTNLQAGIEAGYAQVRCYSAPHTINRVLLFSDGLANVGATSPRSLGLIAQQQADNNISLSTFGVGLSYNENLLAALSEYGLGMYYFIDHPDQIRDMLAREFQAVEKLVASDIRIEVNLQPDIEICEVMANRYEIHGNRVIMYGGDLAAGERRRFQIRIRPSHHHHGDYQAGRVKMSYREAGHDQVLASHHGLSLHYVAEANQLSQGIDQGIRERSAIFEAHYARSRAAEAVDRGDMSTAQNILAKVKEEIKDRAPASSRLKNELQEIDDYAAALKKPLDTRERARIQKSVKYNSYIFEGC